MDRARAESLGGMYRQRKSGERDGGHGRMRMASLKQAVDPAPVSNELAKDWKQAAIFTIVLPCQPPCSLGR
jgi:hypothetical protein